MPVLVVQKGHCYRTTGATGTNGEQQYATSVANACVNLLHGRNGWTVRAILADAASSAYDGDAFVAIHCDGSTSASARGASIGYRNAAGQSFGQAWKRAYAARGWTGGFRPDNYTEALHFYYGTGTAISMGNPRAFIAECGFLTNAQDRALLTGPGGPTRVALAIGDALGIRPEGNEDMTPEESRLLTHADRVGVETQRRVTLMRAELAALAKVAAADKDYDPAEIARLTAAELLPLVEDVTERVLGVDNKDLAAEVLRQLREALPTTEGN
jgi:hypothetical protein